MNYKKHQQAARIRWHEQYPKTYVMFDAYRKAWLARLELRYAHLEAKRARRALKRRRRRMRAALLVVGNRSNRRLRCNLTRCR